MNEIKFYSTRADYGWMSNFSRHPVKIKGLVWPTTEHYFQAKKFEGTKHEHEIREAKSPMDAAKMGRDRTRPLRSDWEEVKDIIMHGALRYKFQQHEDLRDKLIATGNVMIYEHTKNDRYWGDGGDGKGKNMLGKLLMQVRSEFIRGDSVRYLGYSGIDDDDWGYNGPGWYFCHGDDALMSGPYKTYELAEVASEKYSEALNKP